jgi:hypothetical protein
MSITVNVSGTFTTEVDLDEADLSDLVSSAVEDQFRGVEMTLEDINDVEFSN